MNTNISLTHKIPTDQISALRVLSNSPVVYCIDDFITDVECEHIINISNEKFERSTVTGDDSLSGGLSAFRTSSSTFLSPSIDEIVHELANRIAKLIQMPLENSEKLQVLKYNKSQYYAYHYDAFDPGAIHLNHGGQRIVTCLLYLSDVSGGGSTSFPKLNFSVKPKRGKLLVFYNTLDGTNNVDPKSMHGGVPVNRGTKYACNFWFRESKCR